MAKLNENALKLLEKRYYLRDNEGNLLEHSWSDVAKRVSKSIANAESNKENKTKYENLYFKKINDMEFIPSSPCLFNAGTISQQLSSCFIVDVEDNIESIFNTVAQCAKIFQMSGGAGFSMRKIRPKGATCKSSGSTASGVVSFMHIFDEVVNEVKQGNKRNGALKIDLPINHPEIFDFIHSKDDTSQLKNMNISVSIDNNFITAVENDLSWDLVFNNKIYKTVKAKNLWDEIITSAWKTGEPGLSFQTNMNNGNMNPHLGKDVFGNPCHEFVNLPYTSCNLASINLTKVLKKEDGAITVDYKKLKDNINITFRFLDDMITVNKLPLPIIQEMTEKIRPIGMGTMGFADMLYALRIPYDSEKNLKFINELYGFISNESLNYNLILGKEKGTYPSYKGSKWEELNLPVRCSSITSIAPNGSIAFIANITGGIEPQYALVYKRLDNDKDTYYMIDNVFEEYLNEHNLNNNKVLEKINNNDGSIQGLDEYFSKEIQRIFVTANDISSEWHLKVLAEIQKYVSLSISKTINLPSNATKEDVSNTYLNAGRLGIKGVTIYRDGCRENQVLSTGNKDKKTNQYEIISEDDLPRGFIEEVPQGLAYRKYKLSTGCGNLYFFVGVDEFENKIYDCFCNTDGVSGCVVNTQAVSRLISSNIRGGIPIEYVIKQLDKAGVCPSFQYKRGLGKKLSAGKSCASAIGNILKDILKEFSETTVIKNEESDFKGITKIIPVDKVKKIIDQKEKCPSCGADILMIEGCKSCPSCGWSKCN